MSPTLNLRISRMKRSNMAKKTPYILVSHDDSFISNGIKSLARLAAEFGRVVVIAPDREQSAVGHAVTIHEPLRANRVKVVDDIEGFAVTGTPADCVKLAHDQLLEEKPDLVLSGINHGSNAGINLLYCVFMFFCCCAGTFQIHSMDSTTRKRQRISLEEGN